jgi:hypothetical protein
MPPWRGQIELSNASQISFYILTNHLCVDISESQVLYPIYCADYCTVFFSWLLYASESCQLNGPKAKLLAETAKPPAHP